MEKEICNLTKEELINPEFIPSIFEEYPNKEDRELILSEIIELSTKYDVFTKVKNQIDVCNKKINTNINVQAFLILNNKGEPEPTTGNYVNIFNKDPYLKALFCYDEFDRKVKCCTETGTLRNWTDDDESKLKVYIEENYNIYHHQKFYDAFRAVAVDRKIHPIKDIIESEEWDGTPRIDGFLRDVMGCENDDYTREVSRMIFYGGINRLYEPGCKFDYMPILIGKQGGGKSTIIKWLALDDKYYTDITNIEGKEGIEILDSSWVCEMGELLAMVRTKEVEMLKAYISRTSDRYRAPYGKYANDIPRHCIFIGSTNDMTFLMDKTGNRRYLPIVCNSNGRDIYKQRWSIKKYILQCWREALYLMKHDKTYLYISSEYDNIVLEHQRRAVMEDPRIGLILSYLNDKKSGDKVSGIELFTKCLNGLKKNYNTSEGKEISRIMDMLDGWYRCDRFYDKDFGQQRGWIKLDKKQEQTKRITIFDNDKYQEEDDFEDLE